MEKKRLKDVSEVIKTQEGVKIEVKENVNAKDVEEIVNNCKTGKCDCMTEQMKAKVSFMDFRIEKGKPVIEIKGDITEEDIKQAMERSQKVL
ncbi:hypothetical protein [Hydrogenobaculum acidophilum]